jgi:hypothetical protein
VLVLPAFNCRIKLAMFTPSEPTTIYTRCVRWCVRWVPRVHVETGGAHWRRGDGLAGGQRPAQQASCARADHWLIALEVAHHHKLCTARSMLTLCHRFSIVVNSCRRLFLLA